MILAVYQDRWLAVERGLLSKSSIQVMVARALGSHDPDPGVRNPDWLAERFVGPAEREAVAGTVWETALDLDWREAVKIPDLDRQVRVHLVRTLFTDEKLLKALQRGARQVVILGAGFDTRAYRFRSMFPDVRFIELDYGPTQEYKKKRVAEIFGGLPSHVTYATIDFNKDTLEDVLAKAEYRATELSFFVWEGVAYYLPESAVLETLRCVAQNAAPGTTIAMDFIYKFLIDKIGQEPDSADPPVVRGVLGMARRLAELGEPWISGIPENRESEYLAQAGLEVVDVLPQGSAEATKRYRTRRDGSLVGSEGATFCSVGCFIEAAVRVKVNR